MEHPSKTTVQSPKNLLGTNPSDELLEEYSNNLKVTKDTPRVIIFVCEDDGTVPPRHSETYYAACSSKGVPSELHMYPTGGHGWGNKSNVPYIKDVLSELTKWLKSF